MEFRKHHLGYWDSLSFECIPIWDAPLKSHGYNFIETSSNPCSSIILKSTK